MQMRVAELSYASWRIVTSDRPSKFQLACSKLTSYKTAGSTAHSSHLGFPVAKNFEKKNNAKIPKKQKKNAEKENREIQLLKSVTSNTANHL